MTTPFTDLPLQALHDLLVAAVKELIAAEDAQDKIAVRTKKRQVEQLLHEIDAKSTQSVKSPQSSY